MNGVGGRLIAWDHPAWEILLLVGAATVALGSAHKYAGGWNDGSRLATVECLVDYRTLAIDQSIFVNVPPRAERSAPTPYPASAPHLLAHGTQDKLLIGGHYYSDKSPVPALALAVLYQTMQTWTGLKARQHPHWFCYWMTVGSSGLAYVLAVWCMFRLGRSFQLPGGWPLVLAVSFGLATVALPYCRHVNNHILLLGVAAALMVGLTNLANRCRAGRHVGKHVLGLGTGAGMGYTIDLGAGPILAVCTLALVVYRRPRLGAVTLFGLAALPWLLTHHAVNYAIGGTFQPANAVAEYFQWPNSPFNSTNMTGGWHHANVGHFLTYAAALMVGKRGFLGHNLPLFLAVPGLVILLQRRVREWPELIFAGCWAGGTWLAYALTSTNYSGLCCSVRWFAPLLAPSYYVLAVCLRRYPIHKPDFLILNGWGMVLAGIMWWKGPWILHMVPLFWPIQGATLVTWLTYRCRRRPGAEAVPTDPTLSKRLGEAA